MKDLEAFIKHMYTIAKTNENRDNKDFWIGYKVAVVCMAVEGGVCLE